MSKADSYDTFLELDAGRALGDLSPDELKEWEELAAIHQDEDPTGFDFLVAELEVHNATTTSVPPSLSSLLSETIHEFSNDKEEKKDPAPVSNNISIFPWLGWAAAACLLIFFNPFGQKPPKEIIQELTASEKLETLLDEAPLATQSLAFSPASDLYKEVTGEVIWNDDRQEGYMKLSNLPANDPNQNQYQLWIVDPERDELPVDGGVFDFPSESDVAVIPIRNALPVNKPVAFVITLEQPGGVVRSKQEIVVALAKTS